MVPQYQLGPIIMPDLTNDQLNNIVNVIIVNYGSRLSDGELLEIIGLILENIAGFDTADPQSLMQTISEIRSQYDHRIEQKTRNL